MCIIVCRRFSRKTVVNTNLRITAHSRFRSFSQNSVLFTERNHKAEEIVYSAVFLQPVPIQPGDNVILAICIVISKLCITEFIPCKKHCRSSAAHQRSKCIFYQSAAQVIHLDIIRLALIATVPAITVVISVRIIPAVFLIVLRIVRIQIIHGKTVMAG